jgi:hypothetical protein
LFILITLLFRFRMMPENIAARVGCGLMSLEAGLFTMPHQIGAGMADIIFAGISRLPAV